MFHALVLIGLLCVDDSSGQFMRDPVAVVAVPSPHQASSQEVDPVDTLLNRWSAAGTRKTVPWRAERENLRFHVTNRLNGHAATAMEALLGPIDARRLRESFDWRIVETVDWETCLEATPKDETDRLFYQSIRIWLQPSTGRLVKLQAFDRHGEPTAHWLAPETSDLTYVLPSHTIDDGVPPPPPLDKLGRRTPWFAEMQRPASKNHQIQQALARLNADQRYRDDADFRGLFRRQGEADVAEDQASIEDVPRTTPEILAILSKWEVASRQANVIHTRFARAVYNLAAEQEIVSKADLIYDTSGKIRLSISRRDGDIQQAKSSRLTKAGNAFRIIEDRPQSLLVTPSEIIQTDDVAKSYQLVTWAELGVEPADASLLSREGLPFLLGIRATELRRDWSFSLGSNNQDTALLTARPRLKPGNHPLSQCLIMLDKQTWQIKAVKYYSADGNTESVYKVVSRETSSRKLNGAFELDLNNYRRIVPEHGNDAPLIPQR